MNKYIIGIDLGTTNTCAGIWRNNNFELIYDKSSNFNIPSIVAFTNKYIYDKSKFVGYDAKHQMELNHENTYYEVKRIIGRSITDPYIIELINSGILSYNISSNNNNHLLLDSTLSNDKKFTPEEISAFILLHIKQLAQAQLNETITDCVITVPANFTDYQRQATIDSATIAGLNCIRILNEPIAGALAYGFYDKSRALDKEINILVYDFGGGTLDVSIVNIYDGIFDVVGSSGCSHFGGSDFDARIMNFCLLKFNQKHNLKITEIDIPRLNIQKLKTYSENSKKSLSNNFKTSIIINNFYEAFELNVELTQDMIPQLFSDLLFKCLEPVIDIMHNTKLSIEQIDEVVLIGGMTKFPIIKQTMQQFFQRELKHIVDPDFTIAMGASIQGFLIENQINEIKNNVFSNNITLLNKTTLSIGIEINNGIMDIIIPSNSNIPISIKKYYTTDTDFSDDVLIKIYEGERKLTKDNYLLGSIFLENLPKQLKGILKIGITISIDNNGLINIIAEEESMHNKKDLLITYDKNRLSDTEIETLIKDCMLHELQDEIDTKRKLLHSNILYQCDTILKNLEYNTLLKISDAENKAIKLDIENILNTLNTKYYFDVSIDDYDNLNKYITDKYNKLTLIITDNKLKSANSVSNDKLIEPTIFENSELVKYKTELTDLCNSLIEYISFNTAPELNKLKDFINDTLLWTNITETNDYLDYKFKIDDINNLSKEIFDKYQHIFNKSDLQILEEKCLIIVNENDKDNQYLELANKILEKLYTNQEILDTDVSEYLANINNYCSDTKPQTLLDNGTFGTNIFDILKNNQQDILNNL
jgi:heat shock protein 1/8